MQYLIDRMKERSTWTGLIGLASLAGVAVQPGQAEAIVGAGVALASAVGIFTKG